jgi:hypothetical protein
MADLFRRFRSRPHHGPAEPGAALAVNGLPLRIEVFDNIEIQRQSQGVMGIID